MLLSRLLGRLAHEIRNPLSSMDIHFQLLEEDLMELESPLKEKTASRLEIIRNEVHRLETTVKHFLKLAGTSNLELEPTDLSAVCKHVCRLLQPDAAIHGVELSFHLEENLPVFLADPGQLTQALLNVVINALQAVGEHGGIEVRCRHAPPATLLIEVQDSGPGVPADQQLTIFEPYYTTKPEGTGLGLWIVQQIITAHGGAVRVKNRSSGGAVFTFELPLREPATNHG